MYNKNFVRIVAIVLAVIMFIGIIAGAIINSFAVTETADLAAAVQTGERSRVLPIALGCLGIAAVVTCVAIPAFKKKK